MPNVGSIDVDANIHGDKWPAQLKKIMDRVGRQMDKDAKEHAKAYSEGFSSELGKQLERDGQRVLARWGDNAVKSLGKNGRLGGDTYGRRMKEALARRVSEALDDLERLHAPDGFAQLIKETGDVDRAFQRMNDSMRLAREANVITGKQAQFLTEELRHQNVAAREVIETQKEVQRAHDDESAALKRLGDRLHENETNHYLNGVAARKAGEEAKKAADEAARAAKREADAHRKTTREADRHRSMLSRITGLWKNMGHNAKQWTLIIGAIAAAGSDIAVLGSAAGGGLAALGPILTAVGASLAIVVAGFKGLYDETMSLSPGAQAAKDAFDDLKGTLKDLQGIIVTNMFDGMADSIANISNKLIPGIQGKVGELAGVVGDSISRIADALSSQSGIDNFNKLLDGAKGIIEDLTTALIGFGDGFADIFIEAIPLAQTFTGWLGDIGQQFSDWTSSEAGRERIQTWLDTAAEILPKVGDLIAAAGQALADLVTPESIQNTGDLLESLTNFMPALSDILGVLGDLDLFGVLAHAFEIIGDAIEPVIPSLSDTATIIGDALMTALDELAGPLADLMPHLADLLAAVVPLLGPLLDLVGPILPPLAMLIGVLADVVTGLISPITESDEAMGFLSDTVSFLGQVMGNAFTGMGIVVGAFGTVVSAGIGAVIQLLQGDFTGAGQFAMDKFDEFLSSIGIDMDSLGVTATAIFLGIKNVIQTSITAVQNIVTSIMTAIQTFWTKQWNAAKTTVTTIWTSIKTGITNIINGVRTTITNVLDRIKTIWSNVWNSIKLAASNIWNSIKNAIKNITDSIKVVIHNALDFIKAIWSGDWAAVRDTAKRLWESIQTAIKTVIDSISSVISTVLGNIQRIWSSVWSGIKQTASTIWNGIKSVIAGVANGIKSTITNVLGSIRSWWSGLWNGFRDTARRVWNSIRDAISTPINAIKNFINSLAGPINSAIGWMNQLFGAARNASSAASVASNSGTGGRVPQMASGGILRSARKIIAGEAGAEAIVPLNRSLSQVDPSVRWLSAMAQGKTNYASGGVVGKGDRNVAVENGAIQIVGSVDPRRTAYDVLDVLAERIAS